MNLEYRKPCRMCRPALIGCYNIRYYHDVKPFMYCPSKKANSNGFANIRTPNLKIIYT